MATRNSKRRPPLPQVFRTTSPLLTSGVPASTNTHFENETRVLSLDWKKQALSPATSSPNLKLLLQDRPVFKCPSCGLANQFVPTCLICRTSDAEAAEAFFKSIPTRIRRISAPGKAAALLKVHPNPRDNEESADPEPRISTDSGTSTLPPVTPKDNDAFPTELPPTISMEQPKLAQFRPKKQIQPPRSTPPASAPPSLRHRGRIARTATGVVCLSPTVASPLPPKKPQSSTLGTQGKKRSVRFRPSLPPPPPTPMDPVHAIIVAANPTISVRELRSKEFERKRLDDPLYGAPPDWERRRASLGGRLSVDELRNSDSMPTLRWSVDVSATVGRSSARPVIDLDSPKSTASRRLSHPSRAAVMAARADLAQRVSTPTLTHSRGMSLPENGSRRLSSTLSRSSQSPLGTTTTTSRSPRPSISQSIPFASYALPRPSTSSLSNPRSSTSSKPRTSISSLASNWIPSKPRLSTHSARDWGILYEEASAPPPSPRLGVGLKRSISTFFGKVRTKLAS